MNTGKRRRTRGRALLEGKPVETSRNGPGRMSRRALLTTAFAVVVAAAGLFYWYWSQGPDPAHAARPSRAAVPVSVANAARRRAGQDRSAPLSGRARSGQGAQGARPSNPNRRHEGSGAVPDARLEELRDPAKSRFAASQSRSGQGLDRRRRRRHRSGTDQS